MLFYPKPPNTVIFRPDSRNGNKDFYIDAGVARELVRAGTIYGDATNGGYMPSPATPHNFQALYEVKQQPKQPKARRGRKS